MAKRKLLKAVAATTYFPYPNSDYVQANETTGSPCDCYIVPAKLWERRSRRIIAATRKVSNGKA